ncbi:MAG: leucine-rich repeat domain-containing protein, partial [Porcipelethomonas sp.]
MKKKIISFLTSAVIAAGCIGGGLSGLTGNINLVSEPLAAEAATYGDKTQYGDYLYYEAVDEDDDGIYDYIEISGCDSSAVSVEIPPEIDGLPVTSIGSWAFYSCKSLESVTIGNGVTSIGSRAFQYCTNLESITIPDSVTSIDWFAFFWCTSLESITIGSGVTIIEIRAFSGCTSLAVITIKNPECTIYDSEYTISETAVIYGYENSTAQAYAEKYDREFVSLTDDPVTTAPAVTTAVTSAVTTLNTTVTTSASTAKTTSATASTSTVTTSVTTAVISTNTTVTASVTT